MTDRHVSHDDDARDCAALHAIRALTAEEERAFHEHLLDCAPCRDAVDQVTRAVEPMALLGPSVAPSTSLRERVLREAPSRLPTAASGPGERVERQAMAHAVTSKEPQPWKRWQGTPVAPDGFTYVAATGAGWEQTEVPGIEVRRLFTDPSADRATMLVRMAAGTSYTGHRHGGVEECLVLEGDLRVGDLHMHAGDYQRAAAGSHHPVQSTDAGCLLFIVSSLHDELDAVTA